jgi:hypothetical protein
MKTRHKLARPLLVVLLLTPLAALHARIDRRYMVYWDIADNGQINS